MTKTADLPAVFRVQAPDGAMGKKLPKGRWIVFRRATPRDTSATLDGIPVLARVDGDAVYLRRVKKVDDGWVASPDDVDFKAFQSWKSRLEIAAVMLHAEVPPEEI